MQLRRSSMAAREYSRSNSNIRQNLISQQNHYQSQQQAMPDLELELGDPEKYVGGRYLCKKKLGSGGFGEVWSCVDVVAK
jgi:hypothetical protein